jgi:hypothetical protein
MTPSGIEHATFQLVAQCRTCLVIMHYSFVLIKYGQREMQHVYLHVTCLQLL